MAAVVASRVREVRMASSSTLTALHHVDLCVLDSLRDGWKDRICDWIWFGTGDAGAAFQSVDIARHPDVQLSRGCNWVKVAKSDGGVVDCLTRIWCLRTKMMGARNIRPVMEMEAYVD